MHIYTTTFRSLSFAIVLVLAMGHAVLADVRLPKVIGSHMVLQREKPLNIWGWADTGEKIFVECAGNKATTTANDKGEWLVTLPPMKAVVFYYGDENLFVVGVSCRLSFNFDLDVTWRSYWCA